MTPTPPTETAAKQDSRNQADPPVNVHAFIRDPTHAVSVAGLLHGSPELHTAVLTVAEWEQRLSDYLTSTD